jgi:RNA polymerase sigma-70 factor (ECF subfamily)
MRDITAIINQSKKGDSGAQRRLYEQYRTLWFMICQRYLRSRDDALDVMQNALVRIFTKLDTFDPELGSFKAWSSRIMVNECIMFLRKRKLEFEHLESDDDSLFVQEEENPIQKLSAEEITKMIQKLPDGYRLVFNLNIIEGYTHKEIAEMLGISEGTSKSQLFKAKNLLKKQIEVIF